VVPQSPERGSKSVFTVLPDFSVEPGSTVAPLTIALLGGIASGKSTVAALFANRGAVVLDADKIAHDELESAEVQGAVRDAWGDRILGADGKIDRRKLGSVVFRDPVELKKLESLLHPRVLAKIFSRLRELATPAGKARRVVVLDVPLAGETALSRLPTTSSSSRRTRKRAASAPSTCVNGPRASSSGASPTSSPAMRSGQWPTPS